jgi:hypothetical protein
MSTNNEINVLNQFSNDFINNINIIFIFGYKVTEVLFVTKDDKCYGFGQNEFGVLGLGHNQGDQVLPSRFLDLGGVRGDQGKYFRGKFSKMKVLFRKNSSLIFVLSESIFNNKNRENVHTI